MYDPITARFLQEDTVTGDPNDPLSLNLYTYVKNNPLIYTDPTGHIPNFLTMQADSGGQANSRTESLARRLKEEARKNVKRKEAYTDTGTGFESSEQFFNSLGVSPEYLIYDDPDFFFRDEEKLAAAFYYLKKDLGSDGKGLHEMVNNPGEYATVQALLNMQVTGQQEYDVQERLNLLIVQVWKFILLG